jgi:3-methyl-2-oxobutanoate hydroxymethyltransferase
MKSVLELAEAKHKGRKITMLTAYDSSSAALLEASPVDLILVGDSAMMTMHGEGDTLRASVPLMARHIQSVRRGAPSKLIIGDMPFLAHGESRARLVRSARSLIQAGANAVKIEGIVGIEDRIRWLVQLGVPVMGHLGLTPQSLHALGGFRVQATSEQAQKALLEQARAVQEAGAIALVLECVPSSIAAKVTRELRIPTIGIGAGAECDGQVLVWHDLLGLNPNFKPRFVRQYINGAELIAGALGRFAADVQDGSFPSKTESYT